MGLQSKPTTGTQEQLTSHAMLVPWGLYAREIGLIECMSQVPISQRSREHTPQTKLLEFLVAIMAGCAYLQDISHSAHPLDKDRVVAQAWGQPDWADYSGVSRTLQRCDESTVSAVQAALTKVSRPFIAREVERAIESEKQLVYDGDLTGRPVGHSSTTYPGAAYGWMGDGVYFGYQAAMVSMHSPAYGRLWLSVQHHPGDVVSASQAEAMVHAAEASTGVRPWRRTDLLERRIKELAKQLEQAEEKSVQAQKQFDEATSRLAETKQTHQLCSEQVEKLTAYYQEKKRPERPYSHLAKARRKLTTWTGRLERRQQEFVRNGQRLVRAQTAVETLRSQQGRLQRRLHKFSQDNETNPMPVRAVFRLDGGFGSGDNLTLDSVPSCVGKLRRVVGGHKSVN